MRRRGPYRPKVTDKDDSCYKGGGRRSGIKLPPIETSRCGRRLVGYPDRLTNKNIVVTSS